MWELNSMNIMQLHTRMTLGRCIINDDNYVCTAIGFMLRLLFLWLASYYVCYPFESLYITIAMLSNCWYKYLLKEFCNTLRSIPSMFIPEYMSLQDDFNSILLGPAFEQI